MVEPKKKKSIVQRAAGVANATGYGVVKGVGYGTGVISYFRSFDAGKGFAVTGAMSDAICFVYEQITDATENLGISELTEIPLLLATTAAHVPGASVSLPLDAIRISVDYLAFVVSVGYHKPWLRDEVTYAARRARGAVSDARRVARGTLENVVDSANPDGIVRAAQVTAGVSGVAASAAFGGRASVPSEVPDVEKGSQVTEIVQETTV